MHLAKLLETTSLRFGRRTAILLSLALCACTLNSQTVLVGDQTIESNLDSTSIGVAEAFPVTATSSGQITSINFFLDESSAATKTYIGVYNDSGGNPGTLLTQASATQFFPGTWNSVTVSSANVTSGTAYWIAILGSAGGKPYFRDRSTTTCQSQTSSKSTLTSLPATWSKGSTWNTCFISAYAVAGTLPATTMVGNQAVESNLDKNPAQQAESFPAIANTTGSVATINLYLDATSGVGPVYVGLYADNGKNHPGSLLGQGSTSTPIAGNWNPISITSSSVTAGTRYWIAVLGTQATSPYFRDRQTTACHSETSSQTTLTALPATWTTGKTYNTCYISAYGVPASGSPILSISPSSISFNAIQGGANPAPASLSVTNTGTGTLVFTDSTDQPWLSATPGSGTAPQNLQVAATTGSLTPGTYTGHVTVTGTGAQGSPAAVTVTFTVAAFVPPSISASVLPAPDTYGWNNSAVTVTFTCSGGSYAVQTCSSPVQVTTQGANQPVTGTVIDTGGNTASITASVNIDLIPPTITAQVFPAPNASGWNNTSTTVTFYCADSMSGVTTCPGPQVVNTEGAMQVVKGTAIDSAGNTASTSKQVSVALRPLQLTSTITPAPNAAGWNNGPVSVTFQCAAVTAPVASCPSAQTISSEGNNQLVSASAFDLAGNSSVASTSVNLDMTPPVLSITAPLNGTNVSTAQISIQGAVTDALSGVASVTCGGSAAAITATNFSCSATLISGSNTIAITATDVAGNTAISSLTVVYALPINIQITAPSALQLFSSNPLTLTGTVDKSNAIVTVGGVTAKVSGGTFTASGIVLREGSNLLTASATSPDGGVGSDSVTVYLDTTPPSVYIETPGNGAVLTSPQVDVVGNVNDLVSGTVNGDQVSVIVNGVSASVSNRSFAARGIFLVPGSNLITAVATDRAGNTSQSQVTVTLRQSAGQQTLSVVSGDGQTGTINSLLPQPLVVGAFDAIGRPIPNLTLTFAVTRSDGLIFSGTQQGRTLAIQTGSDGQASVQFRLGSRNGVGINQVSTTAPGFAGQASFSADSMVGAPKQIRVVSGEIQTGAVGTALAEPLVAIVLDAGGNPVVGVPVTFNVQSGSGLIGGQPTYTVNTDSDGKAYAVLVLGPQEGVNNNLVSAAFGTGESAFFVSSGVVPGPASSTSVTGIVLDNAEQPIPNATASIKGTNLSALTDNHGQFSIAGAPVGDIVLFVDGSTSTSSETFPTLSFQMATIPGIANNLGHPIYLPPIDTANSQVVGGSQAVQLTMSGIPGLIYTVAPNSVTFPDGTHVGRVTLSQVHSDRVPMIPANGTSPRLVGTLQPAGVRFNPPIQIQLPNTEGLAPGQVIEIYSFRHDLEQFVVEGTARVSPDGSVIVSDPGFGISVSGWHDIPAPPGTSSPLPSCAQNVLVSLAGPGDLIITDQDPADASGSSGQCSSDPGAYDWTVSDPTVISLSAPVPANPAGNVMNVEGLSEGQATVTVTYNQGGGSSSVQSPVNVKAPQLTCTPNPVVRGVTIKCSVDPKPKNAKYKWTFNGNSPAYTLTRSPSTTSDNTWSGMMVADGSVAVTLVSASGNQKVLDPVSITVQSRPKSQFAFTPIASASPEKDGYICPGPPPTTFQSTKPITATGEGQLGLSCPLLKYSEQPNIVPDTGPNSGYFYVASATNLDQFVYWLSTELTNSSSDFCKAQCPGSSLSSLPYLSCSQINENVLRHEAGTGISAAGNNVGHFANYQNGVLGTNPPDIGDSDNAGIAMEKVIDIPTQTAKGFNATVDQAVQVAYAHLAADIAKEHGSANQDPDENIVGQINYADPNTQKYPACPK